MDRRAQAPHDAASTYRKKKCEGEGGRTAPIPEKSIKGREDHWMAVITAAISRSPAFALPLSMSMGEGERGRGGSKLSRNTHTHRQLRERDVHTQTHARAQTSSNGRRKKRSKDAESGVDDAHA